MSQLMIAQSQQPSSSPSSSSNISSATKRSLSLVWTYFEKVTWQTGKNGLKTARCLLCEHPLFQLKNGTTNSLWRHLELAHRNLYNIIYSEQKQKRARLEVNIETNDDCRL